MLELDDIQHILLTRTPAITGRYEFLTFMKGSGEEPTPGSGAPLQPGEFILGYPDENGPVANLPEPQVLSRNGSYMAYRRLAEHVAVFRDYLKERCETPEDEELLAAKFMGRWRSGAPLVLAPEEDEPELGADPMHNNDFDYETMDPLGYACPLGSHARRLNPRDTARFPRPRRPATVGRRHHPELPPASAALRTHRARGRRPPRARTATRRPPPPAPLHHRRQHRVERADLDAAGRPAGRRRRPHRLHALHALFGGTDSLRNLWRNLATMTK